MLKKILPVFWRALITASAFWWIFRMVDLSGLRRALGSADRVWLLVALGSFFLTQLGCISRWKLLVPAHPALRWRFLANSYFVGSFFNTVLPTTVGGDVVRSYDLIKATGQWREPLASILIDRLVGMTTLAVLAFLAWTAFAPARQDPVLNAGFFGFLLVVLATFGVLGSRRVLHATLKPFGKIGLGQLQSHAKQFQESLLAYFQRPKVLLKALALSISIQIIGIGTVAAAARALHLPAPFLFFFLVTPMIVTVSQLPISLSGWGVREGATILLMKRIGIGPTEALSLSLICATIPILFGMIGGILFLARKRRR